MTTKKAVLDLLKKARDAGFDFIPSADYSELLAVGPEQLRGEFAAPVLRHKRLLLSEIKRIREKKEFENQLPPKDSPKIVRKKSEPQQIGNQTIKAIATTYRQYEFRSRLEAKWAAFFDLCKWRWSYEPMDFNGWIPDFVIGERPVLVEVKPFLHIDEFREAIDKIIASGCTQNVILLGADPTWIAKGSSWNDAPLFGWLLERFENKGKLDFIVDDLHFGITEGNRLPGLCAMDNGWINQIWKLKEKAGRVLLYEKEFELVVERRWATACNISKWVPTRNN
jgi:hypothetical protein